MLAEQILVPLVRCEQSFLVPLVDPEPVECSLSGSNRFVGKWRSASSKPENFSALPFPESLICSQSQHFTFNIYVSDVVAATKGIVPVALDDRKLQ